MQASSGDGSVEQQGRGQWLRVVLLALMLPVLVWQCMHSSALVTPERGDYEAYWMAARLLLTGGNPYDLHQVAALQKVAAAHGGTVKIAWNPPWVLALFLPFGFSDFALSRTLWLLANGAALLAAIGILWRRYGGGEDRRLVAVLVGAFFPPALLALWNGQVAPLVLAGVAAFLAFGARGQWGWAGAGLWLAAAKPHLLGPFWVVLGLWLWRERRWRVAAGMVLAMAAATLAAACFDPLVIGRYRATMANDPALPNLLFTSTTGALLRVFVGKERLWLQFTPTVIAVCWGCIYYFRHRASWSWPERAPALLLASVIGAPYAWPPDYVLLVPAIVKAAAAVTDPYGKRVALAVYLTVAAAGYAVWFSQVAGVWHAWLPWAVAAGCAVVQRCAGVKQPEATVPAPEGSRP